MKLKLYFIFFLMAFANAVSTVAIAEVVLRDPSTPLINSAAQGKAKKNPAKKSHYTSAASYRLSAVFIGENTKIAIINDKQYGEGDAIGPYRVKAIGSDRVLIRSSHKTRTLELYPVEKTGFIIK